jgi:hypothetical protein
LSLRAVRDRRVFDDATTDALRARLYVRPGSDLRSVLKVAHAAAGHALGREASLIEARDVRAVVAGQGD